MEYGSKTKLVVVAVACLSEAVFNGCSREEELANSGIVRKKIPSVDTDFINSQNSSDVNLSSSENGLNTSIFTGKEGVAPGSPPIKSTLTVFSEGMKIALSSGEDLELSRSSLNVYARVSTIILSSFAGLSEKNISFKSENNDGVVDITIGFHNGTEHAFNIDFNDIFSASTKLAIEFMYCLYGDSLGVPEHTQPNVKSIDGFVGLLNKEIFSNNFSKFNSVLNEIEKIGFYQITRAKPDRDNFELCKAREGGPISSVRNGILIQFVSNEFRLRKERGKVPGEIEEISAEELKVEPVLIIEDPRYARQHAEKLVTFRDRSLK